MHPRRLLSEPVAVFGLVFWNRRSIRALFSEARLQPSFHRTFETALEWAKVHNGSVLAWVTRLSDAQRQRCAEEKVPLINLEDGFIRSVGLGAALTPAASLIMDRRGIYYDASGPSDLELLLETADLDDDQIRRGAELRRRVIDMRVTKYNLTAKASQSHFAGDRMRILVTGQVSDDAAIRKTKSDSLDLLSGKNPNLALLEAARQANPDAYIIYKPHPDVTHGLRNGHVPTSDILKLADKCVTDGDIIALIDACDQLETISSLSGFEALLRGKRVVVHGQPFYAGWGLTMDHTSFERRNRKRTLEELIYLTLVAYCSYINPVTYKICEVEEAIDALADLREKGQGTFERKFKLAIAWTAERLGL